jgi:hypothetical protein
VAKFIETVVGDVLVLSTDRVSGLYAVGLVTTDGQQAFVESRQPTYANHRLTATAIAKGMLAPGRRIFVLDFTDTEWTEVTN